jgi:hypothetical protein
MMMRGSSDCGVQLSYGTPCLLGRRSGFWVAFLPRQPAVGAVGVQASMLDPLEWVSTCRLGGADGRFGIACSDFCP